jgi:hypothetical protein
MIGQHPDLVGLPELKLFCCRTIGELEASLPRYWIERGVTHRSPGLVRAVAEVVFADQDLNSLNRALDWLRDRPHWSGADVLDVLLARLSPRTAVEKSPDNVSTDASLARMASAYPEARYLHLARHPVSTQRSMQEHWARTVPAYSLDSEPMSSISAWYDVNCRIFLFGSGLPPGRYMRVRGEDVLNDSESQLRAIASWLGLPADHGAIEAMMHPETSPFARFGPVGSGVAGGNDPRFLSDPVPHGVALPDTLEQPPGWIGASLWSMVVDLACALGYRDERTT